MLRLTALRRWLGGRGAGLGADAMAVGLWTAWLRPAAQRTKSPGNRVRTRQLLILNSAGNPAPGERLVQAPLGPSPDRQGLRPHTPHRA